MDAINRVVALGASNLTRGFQTIVSTARSAWGPKVQVLAALGHGRSYGAASRVVFRKLPGILESGLWKALEHLPPAPSRALITDVGNDLLYGYSVEQIIEWVDETVHRLLQITEDMVLTDLPLESIQRLSPEKFLLFRSLLFPASRLSLAEMLERIYRLNESLAELASMRNVKYFKLKPSWYAFDPIHIRPSLWKSAWQEILNAPIGADTAHGSMIEGLKLYLMAPERRHLFGIEQFTPQQGVMLPKGAQIWLY